MTTQVDDRSERTVRIVSCGVFRPSLEYLCLNENIPSLRITYLSSNLHINPDKLQDQLKKEVIASQKRGERVICLYGECFKDMDLFCDENGVARIKGHHCYEILLRAEVFRQIMDENARSYFLERDLILNFDEYCIKPLELHDREMRKLFFGNYERLIYIRQPSDPDLRPSLRRIVSYLGLSLIIRDADYPNLEGILVNLITQDHILR
jgi:hypothetical protein